MIPNPDLKPGDRVHYTSLHYAMPPENGIVKSLDVNPSYVYVVYKCGNQWHRFADFTGVRTSIFDLKHGWVQLVHGKDNVSGHA